MKVLNQEELQMLATPREGWCISIYMPTVEKSHETRQNPIRFKNLLDQAEEMLKEAGMNNAEISSYLKPLNNLRADGVFWQQMDQSLAVFLARDFFETYRLPIKVREQIAVNDRFYLKPLLQLLYGGEEFYLLALSQGNVRLFRASQHSIEEAEVPNMPKSMEEELGYDNLQQQIQWHTRTTNPASADYRGAMVHGHGGGEDDKKDHILNYLRSVDRAVSNYLKQSDAPLVIAGVEYLVPIYRDANTYKHLSEESIDGNPEIAKPEDLRAEAWKKIKHVFQSLQEEIAGRYKQLSGWNDDRAVKDIKEVIKAAPYGRVEVLFVDKNAKQWGTFDETNVDVNLEEMPRPGNLDLLDYAAVQTLLNGGRVFAVESQDLPEGGSPIAAILRY